MASTKILVPDMGDFKDVEVIEVLVKAGQKIKKNSKGQYFYFINGKDVRRYSCVGTATPDHVIRVKPFPLIITPNQNSSIDDFKKIEIEEKKKEDQFSEKIDELNQETDNLMEEIDKWQM